MEMRETNRCIEAYETLTSTDKNFILDPINFALKKIDENIDTFTDYFPAPCSERSVYKAIANVDWTSSFWTGMLWLAYEYTGNEKYRRAAEKQIESFKERIEKKICTDTHDLGFLYSLSCVAAYKLTGNIDAKNAALKAANELVKRYFEKAGIIQAWGNLDDPDQRGRMIIDCCMNLPLLYWASQITGDKSYSDIAYSHVRQAEKYIVREDDSTFHTFYMDVDTGEPKYGRTAQGYSDNSCWARGQAWGIYGFALSYVYTHDYHLIETSKRIADYFINHLPEDGVCFWDLAFTSGDEDRDSSASAIAVCGLMELSKNLSPGDQKKKLYRGWAMNILKSLAENYTSRAVPESNGILLHGVYSKPENKGVDECTIWGDYFYLEALTRAAKDWKLYW